MNASVSRNLSALLLPGGICAMFAICGLLAIVLYQERKDALGYARQNATNLATIAERDIARNFELFALTLQGAAEGFASVGDRIYSIGLVDDGTLFDKAVTARHISSALILDSQGHVIADSKSRNLFSQSFRDREYFTIHQNSAIDQLYRSGPFISRISQRPSMALSRRLTTLDRKFAGVAALILDLDYFQELLSDLELGVHGASAVIDHDGALITRLPAGGNSTPEQIKFLKQIVDQKNGSFIATSAIDGVERLFVFKEINETRLHVVIAPATSDIYRAWNKRATIIGGIMAALCTGFVALSFSLRMQLHARQRAEENLHRLATSDALTGLRNRRALDQALAEEWLRLGHGPEGLCLIFADIDYFKKFNDRYGHITGDFALTTVASALSKPARRPSDEVSRYGGEEFLIVLPQTSIEGALIVAEAMRGEVEALGIPHLDSPYGVVTVSMGVVGSMLNDFGSATALVAAADAALYRAKNNGRNKVELFFSAQAGREDHPNDWNVFR